MPPENCNPSQLPNRSFSAKDHRSYKVRRSLGTADTGVINLEIQSGIPAVSTADTVSNHGNSEWMYEDTAEMHLDCYWVLESSLQHQNPMNTVFTSANQ